MMIDTTTARLAERTAQHVCVPSQGTGPVLWCGTCGHTIPAADLSHEYHPPVRREARS